MINLIIKKLSIIKTLTNLAENNVKISTSSFYQDCKSICVSIFYRYMITNFSMRNRKGYSPVSDSCRAVALAHPPRRLIPVMAAVCWRCQWVCGCPSRVAVCCVGKLLLCRRWVSRLRSITRKIKSQWWDANDTFWRVASRVISLRTGDDLKTNDCILISYTQCCALPHHPLPPRLSSSTYLLLSSVYPGRAIVSSVSDPSENSRRRSSGLSTWSSRVCSPRRADARNGVGWALFLSLSLSLSVSFSVSHSSSFSLFRHREMVNTSSDSMCEWEETFRLIWPKSKSESAREGASSRTTASRPRILPHVVQGRLKASERHKCLLACLLACVRATWGDARRRFPREATRERAVSVAETFLRFFHPGISKQTKFQGLNSLLERRQRPKPDAP